MSSTSSPFLGFTSYPKSRKRPVLPKVSADKFFKRAKYTIFGLGLKGFYQNFLFFGAQSPSYL